jgi:hypothetical protein
MASIQATAVPIPAAAQLHKPKPVASTHGASKPTGLPTKAPVKSPSVSKPTKILPTDRLTVARQLDILRAYAAASEQGIKPAPVGEVAKVMKSALSTVSLANAFLASIGLIIRSDAGSYTPSADVIAFVQAYRWNKEKASHKLAPLLSAAWFGKALLPRLQFNPIEEESAVTILAEASSASPEYKKELRMILDFLVAGGIVRREGKLIKLINESAMEASTPAPKPESPMDSLESPRENRDVIQSNFSQSPQDGVRFNISVNVSMADFANWKPDRLTAFFGGIAQVLAAKADVEKQGLD